MNYPTKTHAVIGVEPFKRFRIRGDNSNEEYWLDNFGVMFYSTENNDRGESPRLVDSKKFALAINNTIYYRIELTSEQKDALLALYKWCASKWLLVYDAGILTASSATNKPKMGADGWDGVEAYLKVQLPYKSVLRELVIDGDTEPLDIVAVLKDAGVEITATTTYSSK